MWRVGWFHLGSTRRWLPHQSSPKEGTAGGGEVAIQAKHASAYASFVLKKGNVHALLCSSTEVEPLTASYLDEANTLCLSEDGCSGLAISKLGASASPPGLIRVSLTAHKRETLSRVTNAQIMAASSSPSLSKRLSRPASRRLSWTPLYRDVHPIRAAALTTRVYSLKMRIRTGSSRDRPKIASSSAISRSWA